MSGELILNTNPDGLDVLHRNPGERCNTDDAKGKTKVDLLTADGLVASHQARWCSHCGDPEAPESSKI